MLNTYETCPRLCFEEWGAIGTKERDDDEMPTNKYASTGIALHKTMEIWGLQKKMGNSMSLLQLHDLLDMKFEEIDVRLFDDEEDKLEFYNSLHEQIDWLWDKACQTTPALLEYKFKLPLIETFPEFTGTIDRIEGNFETRHVDIVDYKSGKVYTKRELASNMQAGIYAMAFQRMFGFYPERFIFLFSKEKKEKVVEITQEFLDSSVTRIKSVWYHIINGDFDAPAKPNKYFCNHFCTVKNKCPRFKRPRGWEMVG
jgi:RecB family exonuclease